MSGGNQARQQWQTGMAMAVFFLTMAHQVAGKASRDAIFLSHFKTADLPAMVTAAAIAGVAASVAGSRLLVRLGPHRVAPVSFALSGALQFGEWLLLGHWARIAACAIYLHVVAFGAVLISGFWSLMNESFEPRSAKELFGRIGGMGTLGGLCGGLLAERVAAWFGAADVVLVLATLHLVCAGLLWRVVQVPDVPNLRPHGRPRETRLVDAVQRYPFLLTLTGLVLAASSGTAMLDFVFKAQAVHTIRSGAPLLRFFGLYYTGTSLLTFLLQTFAARVSVKHAGLAVTAGTLPAAISLGSFAGILFPGFPALSAIRGVEILMRGSLYRSAYELFYMAVAPADKRAVKSLIDVGADRAGDAVGSAGVSLMLALSPRHYGPILALASGISMIALLFVARLRRGYLHALEKSLVERAIELDPSLAEDSATHSVLMRSIEMPLPLVPLEAPRTSTPQRLPAGDTFLRRASALRSGDAARAVQAAGELGPNDWALAPLAIDLLAWDETMPAARTALERMGPTITGMLIDVLLDPQRDFVVRRRLPRVLAYLPSTRTVEGLFAALEDQRFEVRFYAGRALYLLLKDHPDLTVASAKVWAAINRELSLQRPVWDSHRLLDRRGSQEKEWFFDEQLLDRADRNLEHLFTLLALSLPVDAVRIAFRALHTDDGQLKGTAFEYLESATPADTWRLLLPLLEADAASRSRPAVADRALENLLASKARVIESLKLEPLEREVRQ
jgi:MFS family permease